MKRALRGLMWVMLSTALVVMAPRAFAQRPPETHPVSEHRDIVMSWDRSAMPGDVELWAPRTVLGFSTDPSLKYGQLHLTCLSETDRRLGACATRGRGDSDAGATGIKLIAIERRSGMTTEISATAWLQRAMATRRCTGDWRSSQRPIDIAVLESCLGDPDVGTGAALLLEQGQLNLLTAGQWTSALQLSLQTEIGGPVLATYSFSFDFTITDRNAVAIYFPQFDEIAPHVGMNLRYDPIARTVGGGTTVDMCLYDGLGSNAAYLGVTVRDSGARAPGPLGFSAWHRDSGGSGDSERLDYTVTLDHSGALIPMRNGIEEQLTGIDSAKLKLVLLPGMSQPVFCVHTPLRLEMPRVPIAEKQPGYYRGDLKVELRVPTGVP